MAADSLMDGIPAAPVRGRSLWSDAWRRLLKNRMAVAGMVVVSAMTVVSLLAGLFSPFSPTMQERWIGARPPMYRHPTVKNEMRLKAGDPADLPEEALDPSAREAVLLVEAIERDEILRVTLKGGVIRALRIETGAESVESFGASGPTEYLNLLDDQDRPEGPRIPDATLAVGGKPPFDAPAGAEGKAVSVGVRWVKLAGTKPSEVNVSLSGGKVAGLTRDGSGIEALTVQGREVVSFMLDGREIAHTHILGTDQSGRDVLSRIIYGGQISLGVGLAATVVSLLIGVLYGAFSGYFGGRTDNVMMRIVDILYSIPFMFLVIILLVNFGRNIWILFIALGAVQWLTMARIVRGQVLSLKEKEFMEAARMSGAGHMAMVMRHLIPNTLGVVAVYTTLTIPAVILQESFLAFIGLTVQSGTGESKESWGALVNQGVQALGSGGERWWLLVFPSIAMAATLFFMNFLGDGLRDALDPQQKGKTA